jgi:hypothetical protein
MSSENTLCRFLYKATRRAKPTATSAAATVIIKKTKILPSKFNEVREKVTNARLIPLSINSKDINRRRIFLLRSTPKKPIEKRHKARNK